MVGTPMSGLQARAVVHRDAEFSLDVELHIEAGETVALLGPNGAGKSTLVSALAGLIPLDDGRIDLDGVVLDDADSDVFVGPEQRHIGIVFQDYLLFDHMSVLDNVAFGPSSRGASRPAARRTALRWIDDLDLVGLESRRPPQLSGGQAQRVALGRALASEPDLLLLDEPLSALDATTHVRLRRTLGEHLRRCSSPSLLITHDPTDAFLLADRIYIVENGRVTQSGGPEEIRRHPATPYVADVAGTNLFAGVINAGKIKISETHFVLHAADSKASGAVLATVHPRAVALHPTQPHGSPRNTWLATVDGVERLGDTTRILLGGPLRLAADITPAASDALGLKPGSEIWVAIKATEIVVSGE
jgi:molybdate transport system ATP-binding protein